MIKMLIDTHAHLYRYSEKQLRSILMRMQEAEVIAISSNHSIKSIERNLEVCAKTNNYASLGFYYWAPDWVAKEIELERPTEENVDKAIQTIKDSAKSNSKVVAIGEVGMDFAWAENNKQREFQKKMFIKFVELASELDLPLIVHHRGAEDFVLETVEKYGVKMILHTFRGTMEQALRAIKLGCLIPIKPSILYSKYQQKLARIVPLENMAFETDSPGSHFSPMPGVANEPTMIRFTAETVSKIKGVPVETVEDVTTANVRMICKRMR